MIWELEAYVRLPKITRTRDNTASVLDTDGLYANIEPDGQAPTTAFKQLGEGVWRAVDETNPTGNALAARMV
jgi:hypothetical protein